MTNERAIAEAATEGDWTECVNGVCGPLPANGERPTICVTPSPHARSGTKPFEKWRRDRDFIAHFNPRRILELLEERDGLLQMPGQLTAAAARAQADMWHEANARARDDIQELYAALYKAWPHAEDMGDGSAKGVRHLIEQLTEERDGLVEALDDAADHLHVAAMMADRHSQYSDGDDYRRAEADARTAIARAKGEGQ